MATYSHYQPKKNDNIKTPKEVWSNIKEYIPTDKTIWCPFYYKGEHTLKELGYNIIHEDKDFFKTTPPSNSICIDNPPFSLKKQVLERLLELDIPFILIMPVSTLCYKYFKKFKDKIQIIVPPKRYNFMDNKSSATFDCLYYCYKITLKKDIIFI